MAVTVEEFQNQVAAEDSELEILKVILPQAQAFVELYLNRNSDISDDESAVKDRCVLLIASDLYFHRESNDYKPTGTGLELLLNAIRVPGVG